MVKCKYEASNDGITWTEVSGAIDPCNSAWRYGRVTSWEVSELEEVKEQLKNANMDVEKLRKELVESRELHGRCPYCGWR